MKTIHVKLKPSYAQNNEQMEACARALTCIGLWDKTSPENTKLIEIQYDKQTIVLSASDNHIGFSTYHGTEWAKDIEIENDAKPTDFVECDFT